MRKPESYVLTASRMLAEEHDESKAGRIVCEGLEYYTTRILKAVNGTPDADAALVVSALLRIADTWGQIHPDCTELARFIQENTTPPEITYEKRIEKTKRRKLREEET